MHVVSVNILYTAPAPNMNSHRSERAAVSLQPIAADASLLSRGESLLEPSTTGDMCCTRLSTLWMCSCTQVDRANKHFKTISIPSGVI